MQVEKYSETIQIFGIIKFFNSSWILGAIQEIFWRRWVFLVKIYLVHFCDCQSENGKYRIFKKLPM